MAIQLLTPEQVRSMSLAEKDAWWLKNVYRGDMPQLTGRSIATGVILGSVLSLTNLYVSMRTGWLMGVGLTSVILAFALYKALAKLGIGREMTLLENNAMQSIAASAGYMTAPLVSSLAGYTMITGKIVPMFVAIAWMIGLAGLGILFAFPMKKRFINDEQLPFPEGMATGVIMDSLHSSDEREGLLKAKILVGAGAISSFIEVLRDDKVMRLAAGVRAIPQYYDEILYRLGLNPSIRGTPLSNLTIRLDTSIVLMGIGALAGLRTAASMLVGSILNYAVIAPILIQKGIILPGASGQVGYEEITIWALWGGVGCMTTASLYSFFSKPRLLLDSIGGFVRKKGAEKADVLAAIELPTRMSLIGVPILALALAVMGHVWFDMSIWLGLIAVPLVFVFSLIAVASTGATSITPSATLAQLTQLTFGVIAPGQITTNILSAGIASEVSAHASNLLMDIKPGYMLGAKPRQQALGHFIGAVAGLVVAVPVWYYFIIGGDISRYGSEQIPVPSGVVWKAVSELLMKGIGFLHPTAQAAIVVGAALGIVIEISKQVTKDRFPLSAIGLGLSFVLPFSGVLSIFLGALLFWDIERRVARDPSLAAPPAEASNIDPFAATVREEEEQAAADGAPKAAAEAPNPKPKARPWYARMNDHRETICAGVIAGGSLTGIALTIAHIQLPDVAQVQPALQSLSALAAALRGGG